MQMEMGRSRRLGGWESLEAVWEWEGEHILGAVGCGQGLTTFSWIWLLDTEMLREACPGERGRRR